MYVQSAAFISAQNLYIRFVFLSLSLAFFIVLGSFADVLGCISRLFKYCCVFTTILLFLNLFFPFIFCSFDSRAWRAKLARRCTSLDYLIIGCLDLGLNSALHKKKRKSPYFFATEKTTGMKHVHFISNSLRYLIRDNKWLTRAISTSRASPIVGGNLNRIDTPTQTYGYP